MYNMGTLLRHGSEAQKQKYLPKIASGAWRLQAMGVTRIYGNDSSANWCTVSNPSRFFSHRRDNAALGGSGRLAVCIWRS